MSDKMKDETIALVAIDVTTRYLGEGVRSNYTAPRKTVGELAEQALQIVEDACREGRLGFLHRSFTHDPDDREES